ncbi:MULTISPECIES: hypothetical protein [unclassified Sphingomonas]|uniref:hypothetical protein n=1 Tax=unclassified Sphingomonas TaxID=196159 RepID=UPI0022B5AD34|nr:hypothetical protein [Sphingomonas sp. NIBR02145]WHU02053.1 hypothetical protein O3305_17955 [Sphingomonas sp. NIBR02145]
MSDSPPVEAPKPWRPSFGGQMGALVIGALAMIGAIVGLLAIVMAVAMFYDGPRHREAPAQVEAKAANEVFAVSEVTPLRGINLTEIVIATERSIGRGGGSYSAGEPADDRNVILLDKASGASRKILPDNSRRILERQYLAGASGGDAAQKKPEPPFAYYLFRVRAQAGKEDVLVGDLATGRQAFLLTGLDGVDKIWMQSPTRVALLMRQGRKLQYRAIEIPALKVVVARPVEID